MSVSIEKLDGNRFIAKGVICFENAESWAKAGEAALSGSSGLVQIDLSGILQTSSVGLSVLLSWMRAAKAKGMQLNFTGMPAAMFDIARVSGLDDVLPIQRAAR
ncbi:MAG TPA: STAS domain-containing protein [Pseudomonadales bacterium]|nr:STAS domain-containing protein [Pseudomonadales bacterium]